MTRLIYLQKWSLSYSWISGMLSWQWPSKIRLRKKRLAWFLFNWWSNISLQCEYSKKYHEGCGDRKYYKLMYLYDVNMIETDMSDTVFPLSEKATFTFITYIRNYNASYQFEVTTLEEGLMLWATNIDILNRQQRKVLLKYIQKSKNNPIAVEGVKNVWSTSYRIFRPLLTLHIVKTVSW